MNTKNVSLEHTRVRVVIVGGGSAGWLTACIVAAMHNCVASREVTVTLIESPNIPTIGVGEGTWPTMADTLERIGISESEFIRSAGASFKQGTRFKGWRSDRGLDTYDHPFSLPLGYGKLDYTKIWQSETVRSDLIGALCSQIDVCAKGLAPKQKSTPDFASVLTYGYHLDAAKFVELLRRHAVTNLGVRHISDDVVGVIGEKGAPVASVMTSNCGEVVGDVFVDCSGERGVLVKKHFGAVPLNRSDCLSNDSAWAIQIFETDDSPIASQTISTATPCGWIWDIGLPSRRGVGHVFASKHADPIVARDKLEKYIEANGAGGSVDIEEARLIHFTTQYLERPWQKNCVAIGMSAGFMEPLEASALVMVELTATEFSQQLLVAPEQMDLVAKRFNDQVCYRWERVIDFLKLHYVLSKRTDPYWQDAKSLDSASQRLRDLLKLWQSIAPSRYDFPKLKEVFPAASYIFVLLGMGHQPKSLQGILSPSEQQTFNAAKAKYYEEVKQYEKWLPTNRALIDHICST